MTLTDRILFSVRSPLTAQQIAVHHQAQYDIVRLLLRRLEKKGKVRRVGFDREHKKAGTKPFLWAST